MKRILCFVMILVAAACASAGGGGGDGALQGSWGTPTSIFNDGACQIAAPAVDDSGNGIAGWFCTNVRVTPMTYSFATDAWSAAFTTTSGGGSFLQVAKRSTGEGLAIWAGAVSTTSMLWTSSYDGAAFGAPETVALFDSLLSGFEFEAADDGRAVVLAAESGVGHWALRREASGTWQPRALVTSGILLMLAFDMNSNGEGHALFTSETELVDYQLAADGTWSGPRVIATTPDGLGLAFERARVAVNDIGDAVAVFDPTEDSVHAAAFHDGTWTPAEMLIDFPVSSLRLGIDDAGGAIAAFLYTGDFSGDDLWTAAYDPVTGWADPIQLNAPDYSTIDSYDLVVTGSGTGLMLFGEYVLIDQTYTTRTMMSLVSTASGAEAAQPVAAFGGLSPTEIRLGTNDDGVVLGLFRGGEILAASYR